MTASDPAAPARRFYSRSPAVHVAGRAVRLLHRVSPSLGLRGAVTLFFTPMPWKLATRPRLARTWHREQWPFEGSGIAIHRRADALRDAPRVLLVHGWAGSAAHLAPVGERLLAAGYDPVLLELPAHGWSGGWRTNLPQAARALFHTVARLGPLAGIVAHSLGAGATLYAASRGLPVDRLALVSPPGPPLAFIEWFVRVLELPPHVAGDMRSHIERREGIDFDHFETGWLAERVRQPTLVLHDRADAVAPFHHGERLAAALPNAELVATEGLGHRRILDHGELHERIVRHLGGA